MPCNDDRDGSEAIAELSRKLDKITNMLCRVLTDNETPGYQLPLPKDIQTWWDNHKRWDKERKLQEEKRKQERALEREVAAYAANLRKKRGLS
jgi:hypothetical protein